MGHAKESESVGSIQEQANARVERDAHVEQGVKAGTKEAHSFDGREAGAARHAAGCTRENVGVERGSVAFVANARRGISSHSGVTDLAGSSQSGLGLREVELRQRPKGGRAVG
eukprot:3241147-Pleurochrysis_carterae.AAC.1